MRIFVLASLLLLIPTAFADAGTPQSDERAAIDKAQAEYRTALLNADVSALAKIWSDDYTFTNSRGMFLSKDDRLQNIQTSATEFKSIKFTGREVQFYGDVAIVTGQVALEAKYSGQGGSGDYRYINVWVKRGDSWQMAANQITPIVE